MKIILFFILFQLNALMASSDEFEADAKKLATTLKASLLQQVTRVIAKKGINEAITFCHGNVKEVAGKAAGSLKEKYTFGRTSLKVRNPKNTPEPWMISYLEKFATSQEGSANSVTHQLENGKRVYLDPIYMKPVCLQCHGEHVSKDTLDRIRSLYPLDQATGLKLGQFRGFVWVKEK